MTSYYVDFTKSALPNPEPGSTPMESMLVIGDPNVAWSSQGLTLHYSNTGAENNPPSVSVMLDTSGGDYLQTGILNLRLVFDQAVGTTLQEQRVPQPHPSSPDPTKVAPGYAPWTAWGVFLVAKTEGTSDNGAASYVAGCQFRDDGYRLRMPGNVVPVPPNLRTQKYAGSPHQDFPYLESIGPEEAQIRSFRVDLQMNCTGPPNTLPKAQGTLTLLSRRYTERGKTYYSEEKQQSSDTLSFPSFPADAKVPGISAIGIQVPIFAGLGQVSVRLKEFSIQAGPASA